MHGSLRIARWRVATLAAVTLAGALSFLLSPVTLTPASAACASPTQTIGGAFVGEDDRTISGFVGIVLYDVAGNPIGMDGCPRAVGGYVADDRINATANGCCFTRTVDGGGSGNERTWQISGIPSNATMAFVEAYPKSSTGDPSGLYSGFTDYRRYGGALRKWVPLNTNNHFHLPLNCGLGSAGDNGSIEAVVYRDGAAAPVYYAVAFSNLPPGIDTTYGFVASNDAGSGRFTIPSLAPNQRYAIEINTTDGERYWFEHDYGYGVAVSPCTATRKTFVLDRSTGRAIAIDGVSSGPGAADQAGTRNVFYRGGDGALWQLVDGARQPAQHLGGQIVGEPDATSWGPGRTDVVARGADGQAWWRYYDNRTGGWGPWLALGGGTGYSPSVVSWAPGRLDVVITGLDGQLWHRWTGNAGATWSGWSPLGGSLTSSPDIASWGLHRLDVVARGREGAVWHLTWANAWQPWEYLGGRIAGGPAASSAAGNRLDVAVWGAGNQVYLMRWNGAGWTAWAGLNGGLTDAEPDIASYGGISTVYVRGSDGAIWRTERPGINAAFGSWGALPS